MKYFTNQLVSRLAQLSAVVFIVCFVSLISKATDYYVIPNGNVGTISPYPTDNNITVTYLNSASTIFGTGDIVYFLRNGIYRGPITPHKVANAIVTFDAYGEGEKPIILASVSAKSTVSKWSYYSTNIYVSVDKYNTLTDDIGNIYFGSSIISEEQTAAHKVMWIPNQDYTLAKNLTEHVSKLLDPLDFFYCPDNGKVYLKSSTDPDNLGYNSIEVALHENNVDLDNITNNTGYLYFNNLHVRFGGWCGFRGNGANNSIKKIQIQNCDMSYLGGGKQAGQTGNYPVIRHGNGFTIYGSCENITVERCKIWEVFDSGVSFQFGSSTPAITNNNVYFRNNLIYNCGMSGVEIFNNSTYGQTNNIYVENNTIVNCIGGWAKSGEHYDKSSGKLKILNDGGTINFGEIYGSISNIYVRNNIFHQSERFLASISCTARTRFNTGGMTWVDNNWFTTLNNSIENGFYLPATGGGGKYTFSNFSTFKSLASFVDDDDALFTNTLFHDPANLNYRLQPTSICKNNGTPNTTYPLTNDFNGDPRTGTIDIGAFEYALPTATLQNNPQTIVLGQSATLTVDLKGLAPWTITYTNSQSNWTIEDISTTPYTISITPNKTRTWSLTEVKDAYGTVGTPAGTCTITVNQAALLINPNQPSKLSEVATAVSEMSAKPALSFNVFPNPSAGMYELVMKGASQTAKFRVFTIDGKELRNGDVVDGKATLNLTDAKAGMYMLKLMDETNGNAQKLIIKN